MPCAILLLASMQYADSGVSRSSYHRVFPGPWLSGVSDTATLDIDVRLGRL